MYHDFSHMGYIKVSCQPVRLVWRHVPFQIIFLYLGILSTRELSFETFVIEIIYFDLRHLVYIADTNACFFKRYMHVPYTIVVI